MNEQRVRKAIAWLNGFDTAFQLTQDHVDAVNTLLTLAQLHIGKSLEPKHCQRYDEKGKSRPSTLHEILCIDLNISDCELVDKIIETVRGFEPKVEEVIQIIRKWEGGQNLVKINYESLAAAIVEYLKRR